MTMTQPNLNLAVIGNCALNALIDEQGSIVFSCWPEPDKDPIFNALLDGGSEKPPAHFGLSLENQRRCYQRYLPNTLIVEALLEDKDQNVVRVTTFFPRTQDSDEAQCPKKLVRMVELVRGKPRLNVEIRPRFLYNAKDATTVLDDTTASYSGGGLSVYLTTDVSIMNVVKASTFSVEKDFSIVLSSDLSELPSKDSCFEHSSRLLTQTVAYWNGWVESLTVPEAHRDQIIRAAIGLKLCWYQETGAMLAALTLGLPAEPNSNRNWDYRYCWLRDAYYSIEALYKLGDKETLFSYKKFITPVLKEISQGHVQCMYDLHGNKKLTEKIEPNLRGYRGLGPVLSGNKASEQVQLDCFGHVINIFRMAIVESGCCPNDELKLLEATAEQARRHYQEPDSGFWELRGSQHVHTNSAIVSWSAMDSMQAIYRVLGQTANSDKWAKEKELCKTVIMEHAWHKDQHALMGHFGGDKLDTTILCLVNLSMLDRNDPRLKSTVNAMRQRLDRNGFILPHEGEDDFGERTCGFNLCTFWYASALYQVGYVDEAEWIYQGMLDSANGFGYLSEVIDPKSGELWGNYPQAYSLIGMIDTGVNISV